MEAAYTIACQIEAINVYDTPVQQADRQRHRLLVVEDENPENSLMGTETVPKQTDVAWERQFAELQEAVREVRQEMQSLRQPSYLSNCSTNRVDRPAVPNHRQRAADPPRFQGDDRTLPTTKERFSEKQE